MMELVTLLLFISAFVSQQALGQDGTEFRVVADKLTGELDVVPTHRTVYNPRYLSPYRKLHSGKRSVHQLPATFYTPQVFDLYSPSSPQQLHLQPERYPYLLSIELEHGQTLQAVPEELTSYGDFAPVSPVYKIVRPAPYDGSDITLTKKQQQLLKQLVGQKSSRLIIGGDQADDDNDDNDDNDEAERAPPASNLLDDREQAISVNTRSMQSNRLNPLNLPKTFISSLLYGRNSMPVSQMKKNDPIEQTHFMHFGRK